MIFEVLRCAYNPVHLHDLYKLCRYTKVNNLFLCKTCTLSDDGWNLDSAQRWIRSRSGGLVELVSCPREDSEVGFFCPRPFNSDKSIYVVQYLHQTVKKFTQSQSWQLKPPEDRFPCHNGNVYIAKYLLALLFHTRPSDWDAWMGAWHSVRRIEGRQHDTSKPSTWQKNGAHGLMDALSDYLWRAGSTASKALLDNLRELDDERVSDLPNPGDRCNDYHKLPVNSIEALVVTFANSAILRELLELNSGKIKSSNPPLLHLAVFRNSSGPRQKITEEARLQTEKARLQTVQLLIEYGADWRETFQGITPFERLHQEHGDYCARRFRRLVMLLPFLQAGQDPNLLIDFTGARIDRDALHLAAN